MLVIDFSVFNVCLSLREPRQINKNNDETTEDGTAKVTPMVCTILRNDREKAEPILDLKGQRHR
jgi:hypothetical protein